MASSDFYTIKASDVGRRKIKAFGRSYEVSPPTGGSIGSISNNDVGRRVFQYGPKLRYETRSEERARLGPGRFTVIENPSRRAIDHKFAGALFSARQPKIALAYLRGTLTKSAARARAAGTKRR
jgi:hypothetical protein